MAAVKFRNNVIYIQLRLVNFVRLHDENHCYNILWFGKMTEISEEVGGIRTNWGQRLRGRQYHYSVAWSQGYAGHWILKLRTHQKGFGRTNKHSNKDLRTIFTSRLCRLKPLSKQFVAFNSTWQTFIYIYCIFFFK